MNGQIPVGGGIKIKRTATITDNAEVKRDLRIVKLAVQDGLLDSIFTLHTVDRDDSGSIRQRNMTITEVDEQIKNNRKAKMQSIEFAIDQVDLFSKYLRKNVHSGNGYSASMVMNFIETSDLYKIVQIVLDAIELSKTKFIKGKYNNQYGAPETLLDHLVMKIHNDHHLQRLDDQR